MKDTHRALAIMTTLLSKNNAKCAKHQTLKTH